MIAHMFMIFFPNKEKPNIRKHEVIVWPLISIPRKYTIAILNNVNTPALTKAAPTPPMAK